MTFMPCAAASRARDEPLAGTASTVRAFLAIQQEGSWGKDALAASRLPSNVAAHLAATAQRLGVRPLLIRRHRRRDADGDGVRVFAAWAHHRHPWMETTSLADVADVLDIDLEALAAGRSVGLTPTNDPVLLTCTHGSHDRCCASEGRPVATALAASHPDHAWEVSHIGGDRFAGNVLVLPHGLCFGRLDADTAPAMAQALLDGRLDVDHLRGRSGLPFAVQAAELHLRTHLGLVGIDDVQLMGSSREGDTRHATFATPTQGSWQVTIRTVRGAPARLTCAAMTAGSPAHHALVSITALETGRS